MRFQFQTSGLGIDLQSLDPPQQGKVRRQIEPSRVGKKPTTKWEIAIDVSRIPVGAESQVMIRAVMWNGFQGIRGDWAAVKIEDPVGEAALWVILPEIRPARDFRLVKYKEERPEAPVPSEFAAAGRTQRLLRWVIPDPEPRTTYEIRWTWERGAVSPSGGTLDAARRNWWTSRVLVVNTIPAA